MKLLSENIYRVNEYRRQNGNKITTTNTFIYSHLDLKGMFPYKQFCIHLRSIEKQELYSLSCHQLPWIFDEDIHFVIIKNL